ncbi:MAG TPA: hypothetical protein PK289_07830 [Bacteroidia bacterium]|nr:hypothetical protein [Bacteroidia bacterium]HRG52797.1 hypothetical protein [Bacteroidia bacterium]
MKKILSLFLLLYCIIPAKAQNWGLVWSDEFNTTPINTANWKFETGAGGWGNNELEKPALNYLLLKVYGLHSGCSEKALHK